MGLRKPWVEWIENNRFAAFSSLGRSPHGFILDDPELLRVFTNIPVLSPLCGWIFRAQLPEIDIERRIDEAVSDFTAQNLPVIWNTGPSTRPSDLETHLIRYGFTPLFELAGMAVSLEALAKTLPTPAGLEIIRVADEGALRQWADTFSTGFNVPGKQEGAIYQLFFKLVFGPKISWYFFLGLLDSTPVATSAMYLGTGVAGIYFVATIPEARRRGFGSHLTLAPLKIARDQGYTTTVLHASPMAVSMYRSLGFQEYCRMGLFTWPPLVNR